MLKLGMCILLYWTIMLIFCTKSEASKFIQTDVMTKPMLWIKIYRCIKMNVNLCRLYTSPLFTIHSNVEFKRTSRPNGRSRQNL